MGSQRGWRVRKRGKRYQGQAWDQHAQRYAYRSYVRYDDAKAWAQEQSAKFGAHIDSLAHALTAEAVDDYREYLTSIGSTERHMQNVDAVMRSLVPMVPDMGAMLAKQHMAAWWEQAAAGYAVATRNRYLRTVRAFTRWLIKNERIKHDPTRALDGIRQPDVIRPQFSLEELYGIVSAVDDPYHIRACVLVYQGLRVSHAHYGFNVEHIDWRGKVIMVRNDKGKRDRIVPIQDELIEPLKAHLGERKSGPVLPAHDAPVRYQGKHFDEFLARLGIEKNGRSPHSLRHAYGALMTATGVPTALLQAYMGHASITTTANYAREASRYVHAAKDWGVGVLRLR